MNLADVRKVDGATRVDAVGVIDLILVFGRDAADSQFNRISDTERSLGKCASGEGQRKKQNREQPLHQYSSGSNWPFSFPLAATRDFWRLRRFIPGVFRIIVCGRPVGWILLGNDFFIL